MPSKPRATLRDKTGVGGGQGLTEGCEGTQDCVGQGVKNSELLSTLLLPLGTPRHTEKKQRLRPTGDLWPVQAEKRPWCLRPQQGSALEPRPFLPRDARNTPGSGWFLGWRGHRGCCAGMGWVWAPDRGGCLPETAVLEEAGGVDSGSAAEYHWPCPCPEDGG